MKTKIKVDFFGIPSELNVTSAVCETATCFIIGALYGANIVTIPTVIVLGFVWNYVWPIIRPE